MSWHGYIGIENLALNAAQREQLLDALKALGNQTGPQPHLLTHWRTRLDNQAAIIEAEFADNSVGVAQVKQYLANVFGIDPADVSDTTQATPYGPLVTYGYLAVNRIRLVPFGGINADWNTSRLAAISYLIANAAAWSEA